MPIATPHRSCKALEQNTRKKKKNDYIEVDEYEFNHVKYLVDSKNNVYTHNLEKPMLIGERLVDGKIKFYEGYIAAIGSGTVG